MSLRSVPNIKGPGTDNNVTDVELPDCVQIKTEQDKAEFQSFLEAVITAAVKNTKQNALDDIADYVVRQNAAMTQLVKKLGAT